MFMMLRVLALVAALLLPALPAWAVNVERVVSPKGIEAWLVQDHANPIIALSLAFRGGAAIEPADKPGVANMLSGLLDEGAGDLDSLAFQTRLEDQAINLGFDAGKDSFLGSLKTLTDHRDEAFRLLGLALTKARLDAEPVSRIRSQILSGLARELQDPNTVASREWYRLVFPNHPYGTPVDGTPDSVKAIKVEDLRAYAKRQFGRDKLIISVVGDITPDQLGPLLDSTFGGLPETTPPLAVPDAQPAAAGRVAVIERNNPQSVAIFGESGVKRDDPDYYAAYVMNYILGGGGFASRLTEQVREKRGLAYSVYTYLQPLKHAGLITGGVATANARVGESLEIIRAELKRMAEQGPTDEEIRNAKTYLTGSFPLNLDSTSAIAGILTSVQFDYLGIDYLDRRNGLIEAVTADDIKRVAQRMLDPSRLTVVVVGKPEGVAATQ